MRAPDPPVPHLLLLPRATSYIIVSLYTNGQPSGTGPVRLGLMLFALCSIPCSMPRPSSQSLTYSSIELNTLLIAYHMPKVQGHAVISTRVRTIQVFYRLFLFE